MSTMKRRLLMSLPGLLVVVLVWQVVWGGMTQDIVSAEETTQSTQDQISVARNQVRSAQAFKDSGDKGTARLQELGVLLPGDAAIAEFILAHDELATRWGVTVTSLSPEGNGTSRDSSTPGGLGSNSISIQVQGPQDPVINYLLHLHEMPRALSISNLALAQEGDSLVSLSLRLKVYSAEAPKTTTTAKAGAASSTGLGN